VPLHDLEGVWVGTLDPATAQVKRSVPRNGRVVQRSESIGAVQLQINANVPGFGTAGWNGFFGGQALDPVPAEDVPIHVQIITNWVGAEALAQPGGTGSTLIITVGLVTEITSTLDPTPLSDLLSATTQAINGNWGDAAVTVSLSLAPGSAAALSKFANRVPLGRVDDVGEQLARRADDLNGITPAPSSAGGITRSCEFNCFVAGTPVVMAEQKASDVVETAGTEPNESAFAGAAAVAVGLAVNQAIRRTAKPKVRLRSRGSSRKNPPVGEKSTMPDSAESSDYQFTLVPPPEPTPSPPMVTAHQDPLPSQRSWVRTGLTAVMLACFAVGGWLLAPAVWNSTGDAVASVAPSPVPSKLLTQTIEDVRLGQRVVGRNPLAHETQPASRIEPAEWRAITLEMSPNGVVYELAFLRPLSWLTNLGGEVGGTIPLVMPEMGLDGQATVLAVEPCPTIEPDDGTGRSVVTGTMRHLARNVLDLEIAGSQEPLGVTDTHPLWSEDRQAFVVAGQLRQGEKLRQADRTLAQVTRITPRRGPPVMVFNLEVDGQHVFHVGQVGLLVHNTCPDPRVRPGYNPGDTHVDHIRARAFDGLDDATNKRSIPAGMNLRKGGLEGELRQTERRLIDGGLTPEQARSVIQPELDALARDALPAPFTSVFGGNPPLE
jgi:hypothetical protein